MKTLTQLIIGFVVFLAASIAVSNVKTVSAVQQATILSHQKYIDSDGFLNIVGEVQNTGTVPLRDVMIKATYYDINGTVVSTSMYDYAYSELDVIRVSEKSPFRIYVYNYEKSRQIYNYSLATYSLEGTEKPAALQILSNNSYVNSDGFLHVTGDIQNNGNQSSGSIEVIATFYDSAGNVVLTGYGFVDSLRPTQKLPYDVLGTLRAERERASLVTSYVLTAQSSSYSIPEFPFSSIIIITLLPIMASAVALRLRKTVT